MLAALLAGLSPAWAGEDSSAWSKSPPAATSPIASVRLVAGGRTESGTLRAGVEMKLAPAHKTYWRNPGDSGIPPRFDWSASENVASVEVKWPVPTRFPDGGGWSIGYVRDVLFPLVVTPQNPALPVKLKLRLDFAVCEKLCIPAEASAQLVLTGEPTRQLSRITQADQLVPARQSAGTHEAQPGILAAKISTSLAKPQLILTFAAPTRIEDVLIEGPDMWVFGASTISKLATGHYQVLATLEERPKAQGGMTPLLLTIISQGAPVEIALDLDIPAATP